MTEIEVGAVTDGNGVASGIYSGPLYPHATHNNVATAHKSHR
nr:hypothetical protein [Hydromonas duriensis]